MPSCNSDIRCRCPDQCGSLRLLHPCNMRLSDTHPHNSEPHTVGTLPAENTSAGPDRPQSVPYDIMCFWNGPKPLHFQSCRQPGIHLYSRCTDPLLQPLHIVSSLCLLVPYALPNGSQFTKSSGFCQMPSGALSALEIRT